MISLDSAIRSVAVPLLCAAFFGCAPEREPESEPKTISYDWLQGEWISSIEQTVAANNTRGKPTSPSAGKLLWSIQGSRLYSTDHSIDLQEDSLFEIEAVSETELRLNNEKLNDFIISKTDTGFCSEPLGIASDLITIDCFVPYR